MKNQELIDMFNSLDKLDRLSGPAFTRYISALRQKLSSEMINLRKAGAPTDKFMEYEKKRIDLCTKYAKVNEKNEPVEQNKMFVIKDGFTEIFNDELNKLKEEYKEILEDRKAQLVELSDFLNRESEVELPTIIENDIPENITCGERKVFEKLIKG